MARQGPKWADIADIAGAGEGAGGSRWPRWSITSLVTANLIPLLGVIFLGWRVFPIMLLFSLENVVIGFYNVLRMRRATCDWGELRRMSQGVSTKAGFIAFFCVHYGMFSLGQLFFVCVLFSSGGLFGGAEPTGYNPWPMALAFLGICISHGVSYVRNYIRGGEYKRITCKQLFFRPYGRTMVMHLAILFGAWAITATGTGIVALVLLVLLKIGLDLIAHLRERKKFARP